MIKPSEENVFTSQSLPQMSITHPQILVTHQPLPKMSERDNYYLVSYYQS